MVRFVVRSTHLMESRDLFFLFGCVVFGGRESRGSIVQRISGIPFLYLCCLLGFSFFSCPGRMFAFAAYFVFHRFLFGLTFLPFTWLPFFCLSLNSTHSPSRFSLPFSLSLTLQFHLGRLVLFAVIFFGTF